MHLNRILDGKGMWSWMNRGMLHRKAGRSAIINIETHLIRYNGHVYAESLMDSMFWQKYLNVFDRLYVLARMKVYEGEDLKQWIVSDYKGVHFLPLPDYRGPKGYLLNYIKLCRCVKNYALSSRNITCAIIRSPSPSGYRFLKYWKKTGRPYGMEITSNLSDSYYYSTGLLHSVIYKRLHIQTKRYAREASGVAYVTKKVLQKIYPADGIQESYSSLDLPQRLFYRRPALKKKKDEYVLIHVSTLALDVKGNEEFFQVQKKLMDQGYQVRSVVVGGGRLRGYYEQRAEELGLYEHTRFTGHISGKDDLMKELRKADIFLFPTLSEGLPRTVIEAMANSLPCVSSDIPSLRELLERQWLCAPGNVDGLAEKVKKLIDHVELYNETAGRNYHAAGDYEYSVLNERRSRFYEMLCQKSGGTN